MVINILVDMKLVFNIGMLCFVLPILVVAGIYQQQPQN